jgi:N-acetylglutamate synthase-like GNAT family acetyltransferase
MYLLAQLSGVSASQYAAMTFPSYQFILQTSNLADSIIAIGASINQTPIALVLAETYPQEKTAIILSIFVKPEYRNQGIATDLLIHLEQSLRERGYQAVELVYTTGKSTTPALEHLLDKCGWNQPQLRLLIGKATSEQMIEAPWLYKYSLPEDFTIFPWPDLTEAERTAILEKQEKQAWYPDNLSPFVQEQEIEPLNSLGLRHQGQVVGWMVTHRIAPDTIRYTRLFVKQELQKMGRAIPLLAESIKLQCSTDIPYGIWTIQQDNLGMLNFMKRRMAPYLSSLQESRGVLKTLN